MSKKSASESTWSISSFYNKAWSLTKNNPKLWILGFALSIFAASSGGNARINNNSFDSFRSPDKPASVEENVDGTMGSLDADLPLDDSSMPALDDQPNEKLVLFSDFGKQLWDTLPKATLIPVFAAEMIILFLFGITFSFIAAAWAHSALIVAVKDTASKKFESLAQSSQRAFQFIKPFIYLSIVPALKFFLAIVGAIMVFGILMSLVQGSMVGGLLSAILVIGFILGLFYLIFRFIVALVWAHRFVTHQNMKGKAAFSAGWDLSKNTYWKGIKLGGVNALVLGLFGLLMMIPTGLTGLGAFFSIQESGFTFIKLLPTFITLLISMPFMQLAGAVMNVFKVSVWEYAFEEIMTKTDKNEEHK